MIGLLPLPFLYRVWTLRGSTSLKESMWVWSVDSNEANWFIWLHQIVYDTLGFVFLSTLFSALNCSSAVDDPSDPDTATTKYRLVSQPSIVCWSGYHWSLAVLAIPLIIWVYANLCYAEIFDSTGTLRSEAYVLGSSSGADAPLMNRYTLRFDIHPLFAILMSSWKVVLAAIGVFFRDHLTSGGGAAAAGSEYSSAEVRLWSLLLGLSIMLFANWLLAPCQIVQINYLRFLVTAIALYATVVGLVTIRLNNPDEWDSFIIYMVGTGLLIIGGVVGWAFSVYETLGVPPNEQSSREFGPRELDGAMLLIVRNRSRAIITFALGMSVGILCLIFGSLIETGDSDTHGHSRGWIWMSLLPYIFIPCTLYACTPNDDDTNGLNAIVGEQRVAWPVIREFSHGALVVSMYAIPAVLLRFDRIGWFGVLMSCLAHTAILSSTGGLLYWKSKDS